MHAHAIYKKNLVFRVATTFLFPHTHTCDMAWLIFTWHVRLKQRIRQKYQITCLLLDKFSSVMKHCVITAVPVYT